MSELLPRGSLRPGPCGLSPPRQLLPWGGGLGEGTAKGFSWEPASQTRRNPRSRSKRKLAKVKTHRVSSQLTSSCTAQDAATGESQHLLVKGAASPRWAGPTTDLPGDKSESKENTPSAPLRVCSLSYRVWAGPGRLLKPSLGHNGSAQ